VDVDSLLLDGLVDGAMLRRTVGSLLPNRLVNGERLKLTDGSAGVEDSTAYFVGSTVSLVIDGSSVVGSVLAGAA
jgi:hypothetical protein